MSSDLLSSNGYTWPSKYDAPFDHQRVTAEFLVRHPRAFCFNGLGSGKTLSSLWAADFLMTHGAVRKALIAAPLSTIYSVWESDIWQNLFHRKAVVLHGSRAKRLELLKQPADMYIINHAGLKVIWHELNAMEDIDLVILDESAVIRNARTEQWKAFNSFCGFHTKRNLWSLTGAPIPSSPLDVWGQAKLLNPSLTEKYFTRFRDSIMIHLGMYRYVPVKNWSDKCFAMMQPSIRFKTSDCIDLPPMTVQTREVGMSKEQAKAYADMIKDSVAALKAGTITAVNEAARRIKLMQLSVGSVYSGEDTVYNLDVSPKLRELKQCVEQAGNKCLVFINFRSSIPVVQEYLEKQGLSVENVYGATPIKDRSAIFNRFQHGDLQVIVAHPQTLSHGLNLTAAHTIIWFGPTDSFEIFQQACARVRRSGQKYTQTIIQLSCSKIEKLIYARLKKKESMQGIVLALLEGE